MLCYLLCIEPTHEERYDGLNDEADDLTPVSAISLRAKSGMGVPMYTSALGSQQPARPGLSLGGGK